VAVKIKIKSPKTKKARQPKMKNKRRRITNGRIEKAIKTRTKI
jgi:hypothetical protein